MPKDLEGRVAVVTGGTGGLGVHVVRELSDRGARIHVPTRRPGPKGAPGDGRGGARGGTFGLPAGVTLYQADVTSEEEVTGFFEAVKRAEGRLDLLFNLAGGFAFARLEKTSLHVWKRMQELNATSCFLCCRAAVPVMKENGWGRIVNVASMPALGRGAEGMAAYAAAKAAVLSLTYSLAKELKGDGITVNAIVPGVIDTEANRNAMPDADRSSWLDPVRIARLMAALAADETGIISGSALTLSSG